MPPLPNVGDTFIVLAPTTSGVTVLVIDIDPPSPDVVPPVAVIEPLT